jgi:Elongation factor Tu C-terminal domain
VKEIITSFEKNEKGDTIEKQKPQYAKSFAKIICRIQTRIPIPLEKSDVLPQLGRFTLRDEGKTIAVGKVLRYKPAKEGVPVATASKPSAGSSNEESKSSKQPDLVFDLDTGETVTKDVYELRKRQREAKELEAIGEEDEET